MFQVHLQFDTSLPIPQSEPLTVSLIIANFLLLFHSNFLIAGCSYINYVTFTLLRFIINYIRSSMFSCYNDQDVQIRKDFTIIIFQDWLQRVYVTFFSKCKLYFLRNDQWIYFLTLSQRCLYGPLTRTEQALSIFVTHCLENIVSVGQRRIQTYYSGVLCQTYKMERFVKTVNSSEYPSAVFITKTFDSISIQTLYLSCIKKTFSFIFNSPLFQLIPLVPITTVLSFPEKLPQRVFFIHSAICYCFLFH